MKKVTVLLSCMHQKDAIIIQRTNVQTDVVVVNQCDEERVEESIFYNKYGKACRLMFINTSERGLSRSRNMALKNAWGDYCIFADDDEVLADGYEEMIVMAFSRNPNATIIAFNYANINSRFKNSKIKSIDAERESRKNRFFSSVSLAFRLDKILSKEVFFDVRIGAGSGIIAAGEESVWQTVARKKGLRIFQCPNTITTVSQADSTWFVQYNEKYFYDIGANLTARYGIMKYLYQFYYPFRLRKETELSFWKQLYYINAGMKGFKNNKSYYDFFNIQL